MPTNVTVEYIKAQGKYHNAKTKEEKIIALEDMIATLPKHKGTERLHAQLKSKLAKLREAKQSKAARRTIAIPKQGDAQVCIIGLTQSGKSTLLSKLTNAKPEISSHPYTTSKPQIGTCDYGGVKIQLIEIPSTFQSHFMSIAQSSDAILGVYKNEEEKEQIQNILSTFRIKKSVVWIQRGESIDEIKEKIWKILGLIRIYCKEVGKKPETKPMVLKKESTVEDAARNLHKDFLKYFRFARIWGSSKFPGEKVGLEYRLRDKDILEIHIS